MGLVERFAIAAVIVLALAPAHAQKAGHPVHAGTHPAHAEKAGRPPHPGARLEHAQKAARPPHAGTTRAHACLNQKERRAVIESGRIIRLATAMRVAKRRMPGTVVRARLCRARTGLVYVLTVLARDGKVARLTVDAVKGRVIGKR
jgi:hypothetical protein